MERLNDLVIQHYKIFLYSFVPLNVLVCLEESFRELALLLLSYRK